MKFKARNPAVQARFARAFEDKKRSSIEEIEEPKKSIQQEITDGIIKGYKNLKIRKQAEKNVE